MTSELLRPIPADGRLTPAFAALESGGVDALSVDVFDTLLLRRVPRPVDAFELLGARLVADGSLARFVTPALFAAARVRAEGKARVRKRRAGVFPEVRLDEIYDELPESMLTVSRAQLAEAELEVECALVFADEGVVALVQAARARGIEVVIVSDVYLSASQVGRLLVAAGVGELTEVEIITSSDHGSSKTSGLFGTVLERVGVEPERVLHIGDHHSEIDAARALGMATLHVPLRSPQLHEVLRREGLLPDPEDARPDRVLDPIEGDFGVTALRARLDAAGPPPDLHEDLGGHWRVGATVLGPVFTGFAHWVVAEAAARDVRRVHCLMREGTLLAPLIEDAARHQASTLEALPLWVSRQLSARAAILECDYGELRVFVERRVAPTVGQLAKALGLSPAQLGDLESRTDDRLDDVALRDETLGRITGDPDVREHVLAAAATLRHRLADYLDRSRHPADDGIVVVDLGWHTTTQRFLVRALAGRDLALPVSGLYLVTSDRVVAAALDGVAADGFLVRGGDPPDAAAVITRSPEMLEQLCAGAEGSVVDLDATDQPVHEVNEVPRRQLDEAAATRAGIHAFADRFHDLAGSPAAIARGVDQLRRMLARFVGAPTAHEVQLFGGWLHDDNFGSSIARPLVHSDLFHDGAYLDAARINEIDAYWPMAIAARDTESPFTSTDEAVFGRADRSHRISMYVDDGNGFDEVRVVHRPVPVNSYGLSYIQLGVTAEGIRRIRIDPVSAPAAVRIDRIALRLSVRGRPDPVLLVFPSVDELRQWETADCFWLAGNVLAATGDDAQLRFDLGVRVPPEGAYAVQASIAFAVIELPEAAFDADGRLAATTGPPERVGGLRGAIAEARALSEDLRRAAARRLGGRPRRRW